MIVFKHIETSTSHVYTLRRSALWIFLVLISGLPIIMQYLYNYGNRHYNMLMPLFIIWLITVFVGMIDTFPMLVKQFVAGWKNKKQEVLGNAFRGFIYKIKK